MTQHPRFTVGKALALASFLTLIGAGTAQAQTSPDASAPLPLQTSAQAPSGVAVLQTRQIAAGSLVKVKLLQALNSGTAEVGDQVRVQVAGDDSSGLPSGTVLIGRLTQVKAATTKAAGAVGLRFSIPGQTQSGDLSSPDSQTAFSDAATAHLYGQAPQSEKSNYASIGAGAGALLGLSRKRKLGDAVAGAILGGVGGYAADQAQKRPGGDVNLLSGAEVTVRLNTPLTLRTEIVAPY